MSKTDKNGQGKRKLSARTLHLALSPKEMNDLRRIAEREDRTVHSMARVLMRRAITDNMADSG